MNLNSLRFRLSALVISAVAIAIWALFFYARMVLQEDYEQLLVKQLDSTAGFIAAELSDEVQLRIDSLETLSRIANSSLMKGDIAAARRELLADRTLLTMFNAGLFIVGRDSRAVIDSSVGQERIGASYAEFDHVQDALYRGISSVGSPRLGKRLIATPLFSMAVPIHASDGTVIGAVVGVTALDGPNFLSNVTGGDYAKTGSILVVSRRNRTILTASDKSRIMEQLPPQGVNPEIDAYLMGKQGSSRLLNPKGVPQIASVRQIPEANWYVAVALPQEEAYGPITAMNHRLAIGAVVLTVLAAMLVAMLLRQHLLALDSAGKSLRRIREGAYTAESLSIERSDEIGALLQEFNRLLLAHKQKVDALNQSEITFRSLFEQSVIGIAIVDTVTGQLIRFNQAFGSLAGIEPGATANLNLLEQPDDKQPLLQSMRRCPSDQPINIEKPFTNLRGEHRVAKLTASALYQLDGMPSAFLLVAEDVTERYQILAELADMTQRQSALSRRLDVVRERETREIAREVHDELGQRLTALRLALVALAIEHEGDGAVCQRLADIREMVTATIDVVRNIAIHLRPAALDLGIVPAVRSLATGFEATTGIPCELQIDPPGLVVDEPRLTTAFRIIQAALTNITLHADAKTAQIQLKLQATGGALVISIRDDGKGFDTDAVLAETSGMGIAGIRERAENLGGKFGIISEPDEGTEIVCSLPAIQPSAGERRETYDD